MLQIFRVPLNQVKHYFQPSNTHKYSRMFTYQYFTRVTALFLKVIPLHIFCSKMDKAEKHFEKKRFIKRSLLLISPFAMRFGTKLNILIFFLYTIFYSLVKIAPSWWKEFSKDTKILSSVPLSSAFCVNQVELDTPTLYCSLSKGDTFHNSKNVSFHVFTIFQILMQTIINNWPFKGMAV